MQKSVFPIDDHLPAIAEALTRHRSVLVKAEPGAGKTTRLPPFLAEHLTGKIIVLEPRRLAARLSAERVADDLGEPLGGLVGYQVRYDSRVSHESRIIYVTEGLFLRVLRDDPLLSGVACVILDEFHERNIQTDLALAMVTRLMRGRRPDLKLVVMSATLETRALEAYLEEPAVFEVEGRQHPVEIRYLPPAADEKPDTALTTAVGRLMGEPNCPGHILIFQSGVGEIFRSAERLRRQLGHTSIEVIPLAADLAKKDQQKAFTPSPMRKIVLATNVAETSVTIPGVTGVIDPGLAKIPGHAPWSGMPTLEVKKVSRASCIQRAGRAGRERPGVVYRLFSEEDFFSRDLFTPPDIQRLDFTQTLLDVLVLTAAAAPTTDHGRDIMSLLPWFEPPTEKNLESACRTLGYLGAIDGHGELTERGRKLASLPLHPRLVSVILTGLETAKARGGAATGAADALLAACLISEGFVLSRGRSVHRTPCDVTYQLDLLKSFWRGEALPSAAVEQAFDRRAAHRIEKLYRTLARSVGAPAKTPTTETDQKQLAAALLAGYPDRVAKRRDIQRRSGKKSSGKPSKKKGSPPLYNFCLGRGGFIGDASVLDRPEFLIGLEATEKLTARDAAKGTIILAGSSVSPEILQSDPGGLMREEVVTTYDEAKDRMEAVTWIYYGNLVMETHSEAVEVDAQEHLIRLLHAKWPQPFNPQELERYYSKIRLLKESGWDGDFPVFEGDMLELFLHEITDAKHSLEEVCRPGLSALILAQLNWEQTELLARLPDQLHLTNGRNVPVTYPLTGAPVLTGYVQDFYGLKETPSLLEGRLTPVLKLLAPNRRPTQTTSDLGHFWQGTYKTVCAELARRYPKHYWPDDPTTAPPVLLKKNVPTC